MPAIVPAARRRGLHDREPHVRHRPGRPARPRLSPVSPVRLWFDKAPDPTLDLASRTAFAAPPMIGKTVGKYRIVERLGRGGMGTVYKAVDETLDREVAIKVLNADLGDPDVAQAVPRRSGHARAAEPSRHRHALRALPRRRRAADGDGVRARRDVPRAVGAAGPLAPPQAAHLVHAGARRARRTRTAPASCIAT